MKYKVLFSEINKIKETVRKNIIDEFGLVQTPSPMILGLTDGIDNDTTGGDRSVTFDARESREVYKVLQSASKWKRQALLKYGFEEGEGLITDTTAIRRDANISNTSSLLWDELTFEWVVDGGQKSIGNLTDEFKSIYKIVKKTIKFKNKDIFLPAKPMIYSANILEEMYPKLSPKQRENEVAKSEGAFIITGLGHKLNEGIKHSDRPFDTDDWNMNAELVIWHAEAKKSMSVATLAYSVDSTILREQAYLAKEEDKLDLKYHKMILDGKLSSTIGGAMFMSRLIMITLQKEHIGQVQISVWKDQEVEDIL